ncbi:MAG: cell wall-binding repeat-containing protein [Solirubrobacteraceae bacterium]
MRRPRLPRIRRAERAPRQAPAPETTSRRRRRLPRPPRPRLPRRRRRDPGDAAARSPRRPLRSRGPFPRIAALPIPASLRTPTSIGLLAVIAVLVVVIVVRALGSPGSVSISAAGAGDTPLVAGYPLLATKNTARVAAGDPLAESAAVAAAVYPGGAERPQAVALADAGDWHAALVASVLMSPPVRAPLILTDGGSMSSAGGAAFARLNPAQVIRVGGTARPSAGKTVNLTGVNPAALAAGVAAYVAGVRGSADNRVMVVSSDAPAYAMAAAAWSAKSGDPILFVSRDSVPPETRDAIGRLQQPRIYVIGPGSQVGRPAIRALRKLGRVKRVAGPDPVATAVALARYRDLDFGWGPVSQGKGGVVLASAQQPLAGPAAAALSASGTYGALLLVDHNGADLSPAVVQYLSDIEPGYANDPGHGAYNHAWLIGDGDVISLAAQTQADKLLEILPVH